ncbi:MAG TPA: M23 family metallopeptidase [Polyangia bacterium]|jgi:murein DD-endopeptidase MepM/ murein hydrolase activator NlpD
MGRAGAGARLALVVALAGCATASVDDQPAASTIRELTETPSDASAGCAAMLWPVDGTLSSPFGRRDGRAHEGIDLAVAEDTPVRAACDGVVAYAGDGMRGYGNVVILQHGGALATVYAHNRALAVRVGETVARGQIIARSGQTGHATAPHLHFEVRKGSIARDPLGYLARHEH